MLLHTLLKQFDPAIRLDGIPDIPITGIQEDSRLIERGNFFVARPGTKTDGRTFIPNAAGRGAVAVIVGERVDGCPLPQIVVRDIQSAGSVLANLFLGQPSRALKVLGITGTNGKTTTTFLLRHMLSSIGKRCGVIGTVHVDDGRGLRPAEMTTPDPIFLAGALASMRENQFPACALEVSSHALHQGRVVGVRFAGAAFTNLTGDHIDYHKTVENYAAAKAMLFEMLPPDAVAVVNAEDPQSVRMLRDCKARVVQWGFGPQADYRAVDYATTPQATHFVLIGPDGRANVSMKLLGRHNIANALTAAALVCEVMGMTVHQVAAALATADIAPGRLQPVRLNGSPFTVLVDYAHTDDALRNVLSALRPLTRGKLRVLFGCGGNRDSTKRPRMAAVAEELADAIYVTSDNPRNENPGAIIDEILAGFSEGLRATPDDRLMIDPDRRRAIHRIVADAGPGDVLLLAGKGHEDYQILGPRKVHFDDVEEAAEAMKSVGCAK